MSRSFGLGGFGVTGRPCSIRTDGLAGGYRPVANGPPFECYSFHQPWDDVLGVRNCSHQFTARFGGHSASHWCSQCSRVVAGGEKAPDGQRGSGQRRAPQVGALCDHDASVPARSQAGFTILIFGKQRPGFPVGVAECRMAWQNTHLQFRKWGGKCTDHFFGRTWGLCCCRSQSPWLGWRT